MFINVAATCRINLVLSWVNLHYRHSGWFLWSCLQVGLVVIRPTVAVRAVGPCQGYVKVKTRRRHAPLTALRCAPGPNTKSPFAAGRGDMQQ